METFRILNDMTPVLTNLIFIRGCFDYSFRYQLILQVPQVCTTQYGKKSYRFAAEILWNNFPDNFRYARKFNLFKDLSSNWNCKYCKCNPCK